MKASVGAQRRIVYCWRSIRYIKVENEQRAFVSETTGLLKNEQFDSSSSTQVDVVIQKVEVCR